MKHFIGQPNYSTYHSYTQAQTRPINLPDLASAMGVYNNIRAYNSRAEAKAAADAAKAKAEAEAKEAAATQEAMNQSSMLQSDLQAQRNNVNAQYNAEAAAYSNHMQQVVSADQELMNTQTIATKEPLQQRQSEEPLQQRQSMVGSFFDSYAINQSQLNALYPAPSNIEMGAGRAIMAPGYQAPAMAPSTSSQSYFKPFGGYHEGYNQSGYPFGG